MEEVVIDAREIKLHGHLSLGEETKGWVIFAHGAGSSRKSPRNNWVAQELNKRGFATLLFDLLSPQEDAVYQNRFNIPLIATRLEVATEWLIKKCPNYAGEPIAYFGASTGAGAALVAASEANPAWPIFTVISRGGRPDLAGVGALHKVYLPVLLIVGGDDREVIELNEAAANELSNVRMVLVEGATHLFEEPGTLEEVVEHSVRWLESHLPTGRRHIEGEQHGSFI